MSRREAQEPYHRTPFAWHEERARDTRQPVWLRLHHLAAARIYPDGRAYFATGELAELLGIRQQEVPRTIRTAVERGYLAEASTQRCLVLPDGFGHGLKDRESRTRPGTRVAKSATPNRGNPGNDAAYFATQPTQNLRPGTAESCGSQGAPSPSLSCTPHLNRTRTHGFDLYRRPHGIGRRGRVMT